MKKLKPKKQPINLNSGDYILQACIKGLTKNQAKFAKNRIELFESLGVAVPYGLIRKEALKIN